MERAAPRESAREGARRPPMLLRRLIQIKEAEGPPRDRKPSADSFTPTGGLSRHNGGARRTPLAQARPWLLVPIAMLLAGTVVPRGFPATAPSTSGLSY